MFGKNLDVCVLFIKMQLEGACCLLHVYCSSSIHNMIHFGIVAEFLLYSSAKLMYLSRFILSRNRNVNNHMEICFVFQMGNQSEPVF